jgi:ABC-2 type transport system ATP-binding protein/lipopolysaccharide transport system ATP-binding protein
MSLFNNKETKKKFLALDEISFKVSKGEIMGILGKNGSGKTTLLRTISGIYKPDKGKINLKGKLTPILHIGTGFHDELVAKDNVILAGMLAGLSKKEISNKINKILKFSELEEFSELKLKNYSTGMRARLAFSTALQTNPDILLVDEMLSVGDLAFREKSFTEFLKFKENKKTILFASHNLTSVSKICDRVLLLHHGKMIMVGKPTEVISKYKELP